MSGPIGRDRMLEEFRAAQRADAIAHAEAIDAAQAQLENLEAAGNELARRLAERTKERDEARRRRVLTCAFCGEEYPPGTPATQHELLTEHVRRCGKHPLRAEILRLRAQLRRYVDEFAGLHDEDCPEDDTCRCPFVLETNDLLREGRP